MDEAQAVGMALRMAADHIEAHPMEFYFNDSRVPFGPSCGTPGCALGWTATFFNKLVHGGQYVLQRYFDMAMIPAMGLEKVRYDYAEKPYPELRNAGYSCQAFHFYDRMTEIAGGNHWMDSPYACAAAMRKYADTFHPVPLPEPVVVKKEEDKFEVRVEELEPVCV